jgi:hypothetical protein
MPDGSRVVRIINHASLKWNNTENLLCWFFFVKVLTTMGPEAMFGDTSVLHTLSTATADVIADSDTVPSLSLSVLSVLFLMNFTLHGCLVWPFNLQVVLYAIEINLVFELFRNNPGLCMRFYKQMAMKLSARLRNLHNPKKDKVCFFHLIKFHILFDHFLLFSFSYTSMYECMNVWMPLYLSHSQYNCIQKKDPAHSGSKDASESKASNSKQATGEKICPSFKNPL